MQSELTTLLDQTQGGDATAADQLFARVYDQLRLMAESLMRHERADHTLQPTALVHEAYLKLVDQTRVQWKGRAHFFAVAAQALRRILIDHARTRRRAKRGGGAARKLLLDEHIVESYDRAVDLLALDGALVRLAEESPESAQLIEMRFFAGLSIKETAAVLGRSTATVEREWRYARAWLFRALASEDAGDRE